MYKKILNVVKHSLIYGLGSMGTRLIGFLLLPLYTRYMSPADYGVLGICTTTVAILKTLVTGAIPFALFRSYLLSAQNDEERRDVSTTALYSIVSYGLLIPIALVVFRRNVATWLFGGAEFSGFVVLIAVLSASYLIQSYRDAQFRIHEKSMQYTLTSLASFSLNVSLGITLVVGFRQGAWGSMVANAATVGAFAVLFVPWCLRTAQGRFSFSWVKDLLGYSLPLIPANLAIWVMNLSDIYVIRYYRAAEEVGLYNVGYKFGLGVSLLAMSLKTAYITPMFTEGQKESGPRFFARVVTYYAVIMGTICVGLSSFSSELIYLADSRFHAARTLIPVLAFGHMFNGLVPLIQQGISLKNKTYFMTLVYVGGAVLNVGLNIAFVPHYGIMAAAVATLVTYVTVAVVLFLISNALYPIPVEWGRLGRLFLVLVLAGSLAWWLPESANWVNVVLKGGAILAIPIALFMLGFFHKDEITRFKHLLSMLISR